MKFIQKNVYRALKPLLVATGTRFIGSIQLDQPLIIVSNHISMYDFLLAHGAIHRKSYMKSPVVSTMTANKYLEWPLAGAILRANGGFPAKDRGANDHGIERAVSLTKNGSTVVVFPEGGLPVNGNPRKPKSGAIIIASLSKASIQPINICREKRRIIPKFTVTVGSVIPQEDAASIDYVMDAVNGLRNN